MIPLVVVGNPEQHPHGRNANGGDYAEETGDGQKNFLSIQHSLTLLMLLPPQAEENADEERAEPDTKAPEHPAKRQPISVSLIEPVKYSEHYYEDAPVPKEAPKHFRSGLRSPLSDAQCPFPMVCHV
jgi:hypothetical protein